MAKKEELNPQQIKFLEYYLDPKSETFGNARKSAIEAKYSEEYAENITSLMPSWLSENIGDHKLLKKAIRNLDKFLDDESNKNIQADITKFVAKSIGRNKFGDKVDITSKGEKIEGINYIIPDGTDDSANI